ncbi:MAG: S8 family serine peptidase, partial [Chitinispirillaceae bacterium]|nr:S8 family serine peptidase [Chitinispirillaceae bacterium]
GTSASAPVVAGIVALMLQADSSLTPERARQCIQKSAITDATTGPIPDPTILWGAGRVNALGAVATVLGIGVRHRIAAAKHSSFYSLAPVAAGKYRLVGQTVKEARVEILSLDGQTIARLAPGSDGMVVLPPLAAGVWIMQATRSGNRLCAVRFTTLAARR